MSIQLKEKPVDPEAFAKTLKLGQIYDATTGTVYGSFDEYQQAVNIQIDTTLTREKAETDARLKLKHEESADFYKKELKPYIVE